MTDHYHGFDHPVLNLPQEATTDLFTEMDIIAAELRASPLYGPYDDIAFRQLQKFRRPELSKLEWLDLYEVWCDHDIARLEAEVTATRNERDRLRCELLKVLPPGKPFRCVCGVEGDPNDPEYERIHRPHVFVAELDQLVPRSCLPRGRHGLR